MDIRSIARRFRIDARDAFAIAFLFAATMLFFAPVIFGGYTLPYGGGDLASFLYPNYRFAARTLLSGELPLWNPHLYSGAPFIADLQTSVFYPPNLLVFLLFGEPSYGVMMALVMLHMFWAGVGVYVLCRSWQMARAAALIAALAFMFSSVFITHIGNLNLNATASWLPWIWWRISKRDGSIILTAFVFVCAILAGHAQMLLYAGYASVVMLLTQCVRLAVAGEWRSAVRSVARLMIAGVMALAVCAPVLRLAFEMIGWTARSAMQYADAAKYAIASPLISGLLTPQLFGQGAQNYWAPFDRVEVAYVGMLPLMLALFGVFVKHRSDRFKWSDLSQITLWLIGIVAYVYALGDLTPLHHWMFDTLPGFASVRAPARASLITDLCIALLAARAFAVLIKGVAFDKLRLHFFGLCGIALAGWQSLHATVRAVFAQQPDLASAIHQAQTSQAITLATTLMAISLLLIWLLIRQRIPLSVLSALCVMFVLSDHVINSARVEIDTANPIDNYDNADVANFLRGDTSHYRIDNASGAWQPNAAELYGFYDVRGISNPLDLAHYSTYWWSSGNKGSKLYNFLGVKYLLADKGAPPPSAAFTPVFESDRIRVFQNTQALPTAQLIYQTIHAPNGERAFVALHEQLGDMSQAVVLLDDAPHLPSVAAPPHRVEITSYRANEIRLRVSTSAPAYLVLAEVYYPGWHATVDGVETRIYQANFCFRAVYVDAGEHEVVMLYRN